MALRAPGHTRGTVVWLWVTAAVTGLVLLASLSPAGDAVLRDPTAHLWGVTAGGVACLVLSLWALVRGWQQDLAEIAVLGAALSGLSVLATAHGLAAPDQLVPGVVASDLTALLAVPMLLLGSAPLMLPGAQLTRLVVRHYRWWSVGTVVVASVVATLVLGLAEVLTPTPFWVRVGVVGAGLAGVLVLAGRQLYLHAIGHNVQSLLAAIGLAVLGFGMIGMVLAEPYSFAWWAVHVVDSASVLAVAGGLVLTRQPQTLAKVIAPMVGRDPVVALELGLAPEIRSFVAALQHKDRDTLEHIARVVDLAMRVGERAGLRGRRLGQLGLAALLHDIGKLVVPSEILTKPAALSDEEFAVIETHPAKGEALLAGSAVDEAVLRMIRWHHERYDGRGYPDGVDGSQIPLEVAIISVCDTWDALRSDRAYRAARSVGEARQVLEQGRGTQWHPQAVDWLLSEVEEARPPRDSDGLRQLAREVVTDALLLNDDQLYRDLFEQAPYAYFVVTGSGVVLGANARAGELLGETPEALIGRDVFKFYADQPEGRGRAAELFARFKAGHALHDEELLMQRADGTRLWVALTARPVVDAHGVVVGSRSVVQDITARITAERRRQQAEQRFRRAFDDAPVGMALVGPDAEIVRVNTALTTLTGHSREELLGSDLMAVVHPKDRTAQRSLLHQAIRDSDAPCGGEFRFTRKDGSVRTVAVRMSCQYEDGQPLVVAHFDDVTQRRRAETLHRQLALEDPLTGLANRHAVALRGPEILEVASAAGKGVIAVFADVDGLKEVNDSCGHAAGDALLIEAARVLSEVFADAPLIARVGGDEFAAFLVGWKEEDVELAVEGLPREGAAGELSFSVGVAGSQTAEEEATLEDLLAAADALMYAARQRKRGTVTH